MKTDESFPLSLTTQALDMLPQLKKALSSLLHTPDAERVYYIYLAIKRKLSLQELIPVNYTIAQNLHGHSRRSLLLPGPVKKMRVRITGLQQ